VTLLFRPTPERCRDDANWDRNYVGRRKSTSTVLQGVNMDDEQIEVI
jgi:hypothetical protein